MERLISTTGLVLFCCIMGYLLFIVLLVAISWVFGLIPVNYPWLMAEIS